MTRRGTLYLVGVLAMVLAAGCSLRPAPRAPVAVYDLTATPRAVEEPSRPLDQVIVVYDATAAPWLATRQMRYRLAYDDPSRIRRYANSQWAASPVTLVGECLRASLGARTKRGSVVPDYGQIADYWVRVHVEALEQVFDSPTSSRGIARLRVAVFHGRDRAFVAQRTFAREAGAPTPDARGGVAAIGEAVSESAAAATDWIAGLIEETP